MRMLLVFVLMFLAGATHALPAAAGMQEPAELALAGTQVDERVSLTRSGQRTCPNAVSYTILTDNTPCLGSYPNGRGRGIYAETAATNLVLNSTAPVSQSITVTSGTTYTLSFSGTGSVAVTGAATQNVAGLGVYPVVTSKTFVVSGTSVSLNVSGSVAYANLEASVNASSWIYTSNTAVTRNVETPMVTSLSTLGYNSSEGTLMVEFVSFALPAAGAYPRVVSFNPSNGSSDKIGVMLSPSANSYHIYVTARNAADTSTITQDTGATLQPNTVTRVAYAFKNTDCAASVNGATAVTFNTGYMQTVNRLDFFSVFSAQKQSGMVGRFVYFPTRLPNSVLQILSGTVLSDADLQFYVALYGGTIVAA